MRTLLLNPHELYFGLLLTLGCLATGCVGVVPIPVYSSTPEHGRKLARGDVAFIHPGQTTRPEVIARIGPDYRWIQRSRSMAYTWELPGGGGVWWIAGMYGGTSGSWVGGWRGFFIAFDAQGLVTATAFKRLSTRSSLDENLARWVAKLPRHEPLVVAGAPPGCGAKGITP